MKYVKMFALAAVAAGALMAFIGAGTASATVLCSTTADPCPLAQKWGNIPLDFSLAAGTSANLQETGPPEGEGGVLDTCKESTVKGEITNTGSATETVTGSITSLTWGTCTWPTTTTLLGKLEVHKITGTSNGTVTADGETRVTIKNPFESCTYTVPSGKSIGDLTEGKPAIFHANAVAKRVGPFSFFCPETAVWSATYTLTEPKETTLSVSNSAS